MEKVLVEKISLETFQDFVPPGNRGLHVELAGYLRHKLETGKFNAGDRFPSLRELAGLWETNIYSVKQAVNELVLQGFLVRSQGHGTFVAPQRGKINRIGIYIDHSMSRSGNMMYTYTLSAMVEQKLRERGAICTIFNDYRNFSDQTMPPELSEAISTGRIQSLATVCWRDFLLNLPIRFFFPKVDYHLDHLAETIKRSGARRVALIAPIDIYGKFPVRLRQFGVKLMPKYIREFRLRGDFLQNCAEAVYHATRELLTRPTRPDLLIVMPDSGVTGAIQAILELGVHVPEELRLVLHRNLGLEYFCSLPADYWDVDLETVSNEFIEEIMGATSSTRRKDPLS